MTFWILPASCKVLARSTVSALTEDDIANPVVQSRIVELDEEVKSRIGDSLKDEELEPELTGLYPEVPDDIFLPDHDMDFDPAEPEASAPEADNYTPEAYDEYLTAEVLLPNMGTVTKAKVIGRKRDADGNPMGRRNIILYWTLDGSAVTKDDGMEVGRNGILRPRRTTKGWKLLISWKDGTSSWVPLKDIKESNPVEVAEYALANKILEEPAFAWWARHTLRKRDRIIRKVKSRYWARTHSTESVYLNPSAKHSIRSIRIAFLIAALNDLDILSADISGAYLNANAAEKVYTIAGKEFGSDKEGRVVVITRALYGLRSSGKAWRDHMAATLRDHGYTSCKADPDVWMKPRTKPDGFRYWSYILVYTDDILIVDHEPKVSMDYLASCYTLKPGSVKEPDTYLGSQVSKFYIEGAEDPEKPRWAMSSEAYVKQAVSDVEAELDLVDQALPTQ
ncbi:Reverse transcriptase (RNA-dependent DNA polymerase) [Fragilaria crotonensis]|nr:Reverse transcriptase (RNA-dependent DNA polymerase) [Fragilaria crotonensis]